MPTTNPVPSLAPSDMLFNVSTLDSLINGNLLVMPKRLGGTILTWAGLVAQFNGQSDALMAGLNAAVAVTETAQNRAAVAADRIAADASAAAAASSAAPALAAGRIKGTIAEAMTAYTSTTLPDAAFWVLPNATDGLTHLTAFYRTGSGSTNYLQIQGIPSGAEFDVSQIVRGGPQVAPNLYDPAAATSGYVINTDGTLAANAAYFTSAPIKTSPGVVFSFLKAASQVAFYGPSGVRLPTVAVVAVAAGGSATSPAGAATMRFSQTNSTATKQLVTPGTLPALWTAYGVDDPASGKRKAATAAVDRVDAALAAVRNMFDLNRATDNFGLSSSGAPYALAGYFLTDFIPVLPNTTYTTNKSAGASGASFYDEDGLQIAGSAFNAGNNVPFTTPAGAFFYRQQVATLTNKATMMLVKGSVLPSSYVAFGSLSSAEVALVSVQKGRQAAATSRSPDANVSDPATVVVGKALTYNTGGIFTQAGYSVTGFIEVNPGDSFSSSLGSNAVSFYDQNQTFVPGSGLTTLSPNAWNLVPAGAYFVRFQRASLTELLTVTVKQGTAAAVAAGASPVVAARAFGGGTANYPSQGRRVGYLGNSQVANLSFQGALELVTGMVRVFNDGNPGGDFNTLLGKVASLDLGGIDVLPVVEGHNEWGGAARPLGSMADASGANTSYGKLKAIFDAIYARAVTQAVNPPLIILAGPTYRAACTISSVLYAADTTPNAQGVTGKQIDDCMREVAESYGIPFVELRKRSNINASTEKGNAGANLYTNEGLHWSNAIGGPRVGRIIGGVVNANC